MALTIPVLDTPVSIGDTIRLSQRIREGEKERIQNYEGMVIAIKGNQGERTITVRRIGAGAIGIEKIIPVDLPSLSAVKVLKRSKIRRSKLYFLRERVGKESLRLEDATVKKVTNARQSTARKTRRAKSARVPSAKKTV